MGDNEAAEPVANRVIAGAQGDVPPAPEIHPDVPDRGPEQAEARKHCLPPGLKREARLFIKATSMHGVRRFWETTGTKQKGCWGAMVILCFGAMLILIGLNIKEYVKHKKSTQVLHQMNNGGMELPKITFCNNHPINMNYVEKFYSDLYKAPRLLEYMIASNRDPMRMGLASNELKLFDDTLRVIFPNFKFRKFFKDTGFKCEDIFKVCFFAGVEFECCTNSTVFNTTLTEVGYCHSIFDPENLQTTETENGGYQLIIDAQTNNSLRMPIQSNGIFNSSLFDGFRIFLEEEEMHTYHSAHGISVAPGQSLFSGIQLNTYEQKAGCRENWDGLDLEGYNTKLRYQARDCRPMCMAKLYNKHCNCAPLAFDIDSVYEPCTPKQAIECSENDEIQKASNFTEGAECSECKIECTRFDYQSFNSYGGPLSATAVTELAKDKNNLARGELAIKNDFIVVKIYYRDLSSIVYRTVKENDFVTLISNIGGSAGLCLGFSALTFIEVFVLIFKVIRYYCKRKNDMDRKGVAYTKNKKLEKAAIEELKEQHRLQNHAGQGDAGNGIEVAVAEDEAGGDGDHAAATPLDQQDDRPQPIVNEGSPVARVDSPLHRTSHTELANNQRIGEVQRRSPIIIGDVLRFVLEVRRRWNNRSFPVASHRG